MNNHIASRLKIIGRGLPVWAQMAARIPFLFLFAGKAVLQHPKQNEPNASPVCRSVSIIIPTLNEEKNIAACIRSVSHSRYVCEIIVVDAGSNDHTRMIAQQAGARVLIYDKPFDSGGGRGGQIRTGIHSARGDAVVILHADVLLPHTETHRIITALNTRPDIIGGAVGCRFDSPALRYRLLELANDFRAAFFYISFGDQVQFFRRKPVVQNNIFPGIPLMEDIELSLRLRRMGKQVYLFGNAMVSARRWQKKGAKNAALIIWLVIWYFFERLKKKPDIAAFYRKYYYRQIKPPKTGRPV